MSGYVLDWLGLVVRWFHFTAGIAWIGASFYFVWLDDSLNRALPDALKQRGMQGELWAVHGGGFYHNQKYSDRPGRRAADRRSALVLLGSVFDVALGDRDARDRLLGGRVDVSDR